MIAELISVGTELLLGNIVNTNAAFLSEECAKLGLSVYYQTTVGDNRERMTEVIRTALSRADVVVLNGGLETQYRDGKKIISVAPSSTDFWIMVSALSPLG